MEVLKGEKMGMGMKDRRFRIFVFLLGTLISLGLCNCSDKEESVNASSSRAAHFTLQDIDGNTVRLKDLRGKVVLLNFFATWCAPCVQEIPDFISLYKRYNAKGFEIIGIGLDMEGAAALSPFAKRFRIPYPILVGTRKVVLDYGNITGVPTSFFIDRNGYIAEYFIGPRPSYMLEKSITNLLEQKP